MFDPDISTHCSTLCKIRWVDRVDDVWRVRNGLAAHGSIWRFHAIFTLMWPTLRSRYTIRVFIIFPCQDLKTKLAINQDIEVYRDNVCDLSMDLMQNHGITDPTRQVYRAGDHER